MGNIVVVGSINMDVVNHVTHHPLPGETIRGLSTQYNPGGKGGNQAVAASLAGGNVRIIAAVGNDPFAAELASSLERNGVDAASLIHKKGHSGMAFITVDAQGENSIILSEGANGELIATDIKPLLSSLQGASDVLLQNEVPWPTTCYVAQEAHKQGIKVCLNPAPAITLPDDVLSWLDVIALNETEASVITGIEVVDDAGAERAAKALVDGGARSVVLTLGAKGLLYLDREGLIIRLPAFFVNVVDTTAAGDTFIGAFAAACGEGVWPIEQCLQFASAAAALTVTREGAQSSIPNREEIDAFLRTRGGFDSARKTNDV